MNRNRVPRGVKTGGRFAASLRSESHLGLGPDDRRGDPYLGRGWEGVRVGDPVHSLDAIEVGDVVAEESLQFRARNLVRVTGVDRQRGLIKTVYLDQEDSPFETTVWDHDLDLTTRLYATTPA